MKWIYVEKDKHEPLTKNIVNLRKSIVTPTSSDIETSSPANRRKLAEADKENVENFKGVLVANHCYECWFLFS